ncbi:COX15/CtaA family protein [Halospeciosus flavus]|uniref:COX15/CtaA family protein n=1 Tax=Halospeciosus flavus TaxID=3032283 RepID=A0ABD5ZA10_9EURY|nr:COX15/CtaA family protein [Halospeciosus flavus]
MSRNGSGVRRLVAPVLARAPAVALATTGLTYLLLLLGLFTAASGSGATCNQTYPGCAGQLSPVGLTPPQFVEWFHRLVAMTIGFVILGNGVVQWRAYTRTRTSRAAVLALLLLPLQVILGGTTVTFAGLVPGGYTMVVQASHFFAALAIFTALVASTAWAYEREWGRRLASEAGVRSALGVASVALVGHSLLARDLLVTFGAFVQTGYYAFQFVGFAAVLAAVLWARDAETGNSSTGLRLRRAHHAALGCLFLLVVEMVLLVGIVPITQPVETLSWVVAAAATAAALVGRVTLSDASGRSYAQSPSER